MKRCAVLVCLIVWSSTMSGAALAQWLGAPGGPWRIPPMNLLPYTPLPPPQPMIYPPSYYADPYSGSIYGNANTYYAVPYNATSANSLDTSPSTASAGVPSSSPAPRATDAAPVAGDAGAFTLTNPQHTGRSIRYWLNQFSYIIRPGESQTVALDRDWVITFDNGFNRTLKYRMQPGRYEFTVSSQAGWNVVRHAPAIP
jgi:hypothetical protein